MGAGCAAACAALKIESTGFEIDQSISRWRNAIPQLAALYPMSSTSKFRIQDLRAKICRQLTLLDSRRSEVAVIALSEVSGMTNRQA